MQKSNYITISDTAMLNIPTLQELQPSLNQIYVKTKADDIKAVFQKRRVAIVGSRKVSAYGRSVTEQIASDLAKAGVTIISGLALGVDSIAHQAALQTQGTTIAVLPCGIDTIYPRSHVSIARSIYQNNSLNAIVSEYAGTSSPQKFQFLERNRIIAGLAEAVLITEAAERSGSLSTANHALELGIPVMATPGPITSPTSTGSNNLLKSGAHVVTSANDILAILNIKPTQTSHYLPEDECEKIILDLITQGNSSTSTIIAKSGYDTAMINQTLTMLEIKGVITSSNNSSWNLL